MQGVAVGQFYLLYLLCNGLPRFFRFYAGSGRALHTLAALSVVAWHYGIFPTDVYALADLFQRSTAHEAFHQLFFTQGTGFQLDHGFFIQQSVQRGKGGEYLCVAQVFYRPPLLVQTFHIDIVAVYAFVERADRYAAVHGKERHAYVVTAEA